LIIHPKLLELLNKLLYICNPLVYAVSQSLAIVSRYSYHLYASGSTGCPLLRSSSMKWLVLTKLNAMDRRVTVGTG